MSDPKGNGRKVRVHCNAAEMDIAETKAWIREAGSRLAQTVSERDRVKIMREVRDALMAMNEALAKLEDLHVSIRNIDEICVMEAKRGSYKKG